MEPAREYTTNFEGGMKNHETQSFFPIVSGNGRISIEPIRKMIGMIVKAVPMPQKDDKYPVAAAPDPCQFHPRSNRSPSPRFSPAPGKVQAEVFHTLR